MNIRSASVPVNYEQTSATLIETNSLSRKGAKPWRRGDKFATAKNFRIDRSESFRFKTSRRDICSSGDIFFFLPPPPPSSFFFSSSFLPPPSPLLLFIIRFSCDEVRIKGNIGNALAWLKRELAGCVYIYIERTYIYICIYLGNERNFDVCYLHLLCYFIAGSPVNTYALPPPLRYLNICRRVGIFQSLRSRLRLISGTIHPGMKVN